MKHIRSLILQSVDLKDNQLAELAGLACLEVLALSDNPITDDGVSKLAGLRNLVQIDLTGTRITMRRLNLYATSMPVLQLWTQKAPRSRIEESVN